MDKIKITLILILFLSFFIRIWQIDKNPPSLFGDELDVGYHAYSVLNTGKDYMGNFMPLQFRSLAEWRTPLYLYSAVPSVALFGISYLGVRLPAVLFGVLSVFLMYLLVVQISKNRILGLVSCLMLAITPWHIHYSRAGFEVTELLSFYLLGVYFFIKGLRSYKFMYPAVIFLSLTPWIYNTAKLFYPLTLLIIVILWFRDLIHIPKKHLIAIVLLFLAINIPYGINTIFGGGTERFQGIAINVDDNLLYQIGLAREGDILYGKINSGEDKLSFIDQVFHNKYLVFFEIFVDNYLKSFSSGFLLLNGDPNLRHSYGFGGEFLKIQGLFLVIGLGFFLFSNIDKRVKMFVLFWFFSAPIPAALTKDGGTHATRLFLWLGPLTIFISYGLMGCYNLFSKNFRKIYLFTLGLIFLISFGFYFHYYFVHYPYISEKWWHSGLEKALKTTKEMSSGYEKVVLSNADEPLTIFFLGYMKVSPREFQGTYPFEKVKDSKFGELGRFGKYYFTDIGKGYSLYELENLISKDMLYLATFKEIGFDLEKEPSRVPGGLKLIKIFYLPSKIPGYYLFTKKDF